MLVAKRRLNGSTRQSTGAKRDATSDLGDKATPYSENRQKICANIWLHRIMPWETTKI